ncbi:hypothetical protein [Sphingomonas corticis]|uniref:Lipoprotein n=1 Tax=Sphingomonas corticis TaxID=2722791 RepID=A0ABX1CVP8_9SPHN|nr:hypothetical protein [Sphingomonas corticis]NJR80045.1 hypothetical protein [Sphingomonas corticis]
MPLLALAGCAGSGPEATIFGGGRVNPAGANSLVAFRSEPIASAELAAAICPVSPPAAIADPAVDPLSAALTCFRDDAKADGGRSSENLIARRNDVQHLLMLRSDQNCGIWATYLARAGAINRGTFNVLSVLAGGAGALLSGDASRIFSAGSGIASGTGAAIDGALLHGLTEGLIMPRVRAVRDTIRDEVDAHAEDDLIVYPVTRAIADALRYHAACNISSAFDAQTPGLTYAAQLAAVTEAVTTGNQLNLALGRGLPPTREGDLKKGAVFMLADRRLVRVDDLPAGKVDYSDPLDGGAAGVKAVPLSDFKKLLLGSSLVKSGS